MSEVISGKRRNMEELHVQYTDENGELQSSIHFVPTEVVRLVEAMYNDIEDLEGQVEYWKRIFNVHITSGIIVN